MDNNQKNKEKKGLFARFKKKEHTTLPSNIKRFHALASEGLSAAQIEERRSQGLVNKTVKKYSKTYRSIFVGNVCTFFNLLCLLAAIALLLAHAPISQFSFVAIFLVNISWSIRCNIKYI